LKHPILATAVAILSLFLFLPTPARAQAPRRMNLLQIVTDDQAAWSVGVYGNTESQTVNQDRLAHEGAMFTSAFVSTPVCSPSRAAIFTGLYSSQVGVYDWYHPFETDRGQGLPDVPTWPELLRKAGYTTALFGKWHLGTRPEFHPTRRGFDQFYGFLEGGDKPIDATLDFPDGKHVVKGCLADVLTDKTLDFLRRHKDRPFAVCLYFREPHLPYGPVRDVDSAPYKNLDPTIPDVPGNAAQQVKNWTRAYYASIHSVDRNLGRLLDYLDQSGLAANTIVTYTSDHGYNIGHHNLHSKGNAWWIAGGVQGPKRGNMFDTSLRVPLLVRWPGVTKPGARIDQLVSLIDTFPSVLAMLDVPMPESVHQYGTDYTPLLRGQSPPGWRDAIFGQYDPHNGMIDFMRMIRTDRYKLVRHHYSNGMNELYDLQRDPDERHNLWGVKKIRATRDALQAKLEAWEKSINDPIVNDPHRQVEFDGTPAEK
jgi:uncharacterized sulfatase